MKPLQVVVYTDSAGMGGAEISLGHLIAGVSSEFAIVVVGVSQTVVDAIANRRPQTRRFILPAHGIGGFAAHLRLFDQLKPDLIHCNLCTPWAGWIGLLAALMIPKCHVVRVDQLPLRTTDAAALWRTRFLSLRVDAHVAVGKMSARLMEDFYALGRDSVYSIPNGVPDLGCPPEMPINQPLRVGSIGRLDAMKAHDILIRAIAQTQDIEAFIVGDGGQRDRLEHLAKELWVGDRIHFLGWLDQPRSVLATFDVVAMPSRSEGFPLAMVEAMLAAKPVIATRVGSMPEAIVDGKTGILIEKNDSTALAAALQKLRDHPQYLRQLGTQARATAVTQFTVETMTHGYETLWRRVITQEQHPRLWVSRPKD